MNNIKVTVEYETPKTNKFAELMKQYEEIKQTSTETINYYKPLADVAEEKKLELILKQLETIKSYLEQIYQLRPRELVLRVYGTNKHLTNKQEFIITYDGSKMTVNWCTYYEFSVEMYRQHRRQYNAEYNDDYNILGNWDKWKFYEQLEEQCFRLLNAEITKLKNKAENEVNRLKNITEV